MRPISETKALVRLAELRKQFKLAIESYEHAAKSCASCDTPGACCLDAHFVNVRISRLEAAAIEISLNMLPADISERVERRRQESIEKYGLADGGNIELTYACPLFEPGIGCLVHNSAKPLPCIHHACHDRPTDMPPLDLLADAEFKVDELDRRTYLSPRPNLPLPLALGKRSRLSGPQDKRSDGPKN